MSAPHIAWLRPARLMVGLSTGAEVNVTHQQMIILTTLAQHEVVSTEKLAWELYGNAIEADRPDNPPGVIRVQIHHLRRKLGVEIKHTRGVGYSLEPRPEVILSGLTAKGW
jgi:DNA-binding response OmpR family regulator